MTWDDYVATKRVTKRPVEGRMVYDGAQALWERHRAEEGRIPWRDAATWHVESCIRQAQVVLESALCLDDDFPAGNRATNMAFTDIGGGSMTYRTMQAGRL